MLERLASAIGAVHFSKRRDLVDPEPELWLPIQPEEGPPESAPKRPRRSRAPRPAGNGYSADQIQVLEGLDPVRRRPGMYIGSTDTHGLHHLVYEIVDNSVDEILAGACTEVEVRLSPDGSCLVSDNGRGIPVDIHQPTGRPALEVVMTKLHAGGKFGGGGYKVSGGLHGVGLSVVNALSERIEVVVYRDHRIYRQEYSRGVPMNELRSEADTRGERRGTTIRFWPDPQVFTEIPGVQPRHHPDPVAGAGLPQQTGALPTDR